MKNPYSVFIVILICVMSLISIYITIYDKAMAKKGRRRIPEATLLLFSALGGSLAMYITMQLIRHKTKHIKFMLGIPIIMVFQVILLVWLNSKIPLF
jgi:uncharacterized membrane protein YsdA (DUF1294 family)